MAIKDTSRKPFIEDNDTNVFIGIDLPIHKSDGKEGYFASTKTTIEAVKNNIRNVLNTERGERFNDESVIQMQNDILDTLEIWLPFVEVRNITVSTNTDDSTVGVNALKIDILFNITQDPDTLDSVQIFVYDNLEQNNLE